MFASPQTAKVNVEKETAKQIENCVEEICYVLDDTIHRGNNHQGCSLKIDIYDLAYCRIFYIKYATIVDSIEKIAKTKGWHIKTELKFKPRWFKNYSEIKSVIFHLTPMEDLNEVEK